MLKWVVRFWRTKDLHSSKVSPHKMLIYFNGQNNFIMEHSLRCHFHQMTITGITRNRTNQHVFPAVMHWEFHMASVIFLLNCITWSQTLIFYHICFLPWYTHLSICLSVHPSIHPYFFLNHFRISGRQIPLGPTFLSMYFLKSRAFS